MNWLLQLGWSLRRRLYGWLRVRTHGVKVLLFNPAGELLLIRNSYGDPEAFVLPGGGKALREQPLDAALRELREEVGINDAALRHLGDYQSTAEGKRDRISLFSGTSAKAPQSDSMEIAEARTQLLRPTRACSCHRGPGAGAVMINNGVGPTSLFE